MDFVYIDTTYIEEISEGKLGFIKEIVEIFNTQVVEFIHDFNAHYTNANYCALRKSLHKAKSAFSIIGSHCIVSDLKKYENADDTMLNSDEFQLFLRGFVEKCSYIDDELNVFLKNYK